MKPGTKKIQLHFVGLAWIALKLKRKPTIVKSKLTTINIPKDLRSIKIEIIIYFSVNIIFLKPTQIVDNCLTT
jgi:hypothetical protein